ncbi:MAG TPA: hypothetical protein VGJ77_13655 [Gaiellaceae bacterium]
MKPRLALVAVLLAVAAAVGRSGSAGADTTTFEGTFPAQLGACAAPHAFTIAADTTTIDAVATATIPSNDIVLNLLRGTAVVASSDTATSPEAIHYDVSPDGGTSYGVQVCVAGNAAVLEPPYTYTVTVTTSSTPLPPVTPPDLSGGSAGTPQPTRVKSDLVFASPTVIDPQRTEGEPINFITGGEYWESGPWGTSTQQSFVHRSTDGGLEFHVVSPIGLRPDAPPGGGDTDVVVDDQGFAYFSDLEALGNVGVSVSNDHGSTWRKSPISNPEVVEDRQWMAVDNGLTAAASDNTVFLTLRQVPAGSSIYSTAGSTGAGDATGGLAYVPASALPLPVSSGSPCGQLRFDPTRRNLYLPCGEQDHITIAVAHVDPGQRTNLLFHAVKTPTSPVGNDVSEIFPWLAIDGAGNLYVIWIAGGAGGDNQVYYSASTDSGVTWTTPVRISAPPAYSNTFPTAVAGAAGHLVVAWYGQQTTVDSDDMPSWFNDPKGATAFPWFGYVAVLEGANGLKPTIAMQRFTVKPMHYGQICNAGTTCAATNGDRTMADFFNVNLDGSGRIRIVFNDTSSQYHGAHLFELRQVAGRSAVPRSPMADPTNDAQWPHYGLGAPGPNQAQLDFTNLAVSQPTKTMLRVQMTVVDGSRLAPPPGKTEAVWLTRFLAKSLGTSGEEAYRIFYVGMRSSGGAPSFFTGSGDADTVVPGNGCRGTTPGTCKVVLYPAEQAAASGTVSGNTITIDVRLQGGFGPNRPIAGPALYSVTAFSFGRNDVTDLYADVDATHAFDFGLKG